MWTTSCQTKSDLQVKILVGERFGLREKCFSWVLLLLLVHNTLSAKLQLLVNTTSPQHLFWLGLKDWLWAHFIWAYVVTIPYGKTLTLLKAMAVVTCFPGVNWYKSDVDISIVTVCPLFYVLLYLFTKRGFSFHAFFTGYWIMGKLHVLSSLNKYSCI